MALSALKLMHDIFTKNVAFSSESGEYNTYCVSEFTKDTLLGNSNKNISSK